MESGVIKASISAQNKDTYNLLNQNFQDISDKLKSMDIKIQSLDINIYEDSTFFSKDSNQKNNNGTHTNDSETNLVLEEKEDVVIRDNYSIEQSAVNKFV
jgi:flagellar hook-length control protein FliK